MALVHTCVYNVLVNYVGRCMMCSKHPLCDGSTISMPSPSPKVQLNLLLWAIVCKDKRTTRPMNSLLGSHMYHLKKIETHIWWNAVHVNPCKYGSSHDKVYQNCVTHHHSSTTLDIPLNSSYVFIFELT